MRLTKEILKAYNCYDTLPDDFKSLEDKFSFVIYYNYDEEGLKLNIYQTNVVKNPNLSLYRNRSINAVNFGVENYKIGFFTNDIDSRDGLFYLFLNTFCEKENISRLYEYTINIDNQIELNVSTDSYNEVNSSQDFNRIVSFFCPKRLQTIMFVYDMVDTALKNRLSKSLYGDYVKRVVNIVKYEGGVLAEIGGDFRYMVVGENSNLDSSQRKSLEDARIYLRSKYKLEDIYLKTKWAFSPLDGKWRTNVSDREAKIIQTYLKDYNGNKLYVPSTQNIQDIYRVVADPEKLYAYNYAGILSEVLGHSELYKYYPELKTMPIIYCYGDAINTSQNSFYFSESSRGGYILIHGNKKWGTDLSILLHEIQHYIQNKEGFARGGNDFLAQFVSSVGAESVRRIFSCIRKMQNIFVEFFNTEQKRLELISLFQSYNPNARKSKMINDRIVEMLSEPETFRYKKSDINFYVVLLIAEEGDIADNPIVDYLYDNIGKYQSILYDLIKNIQEGYAMAIDYRSILKNKGMSDEDVRTVLFSNYENLYGELESRSVQYTRVLEGMYNNYFYLSSWEKSPYQQVTIIDNIEKIVDIKDIVAAVERKDSDYVLHFSQSETSEPYLHELGHIVHDALVTLGYGDAIKREYDNDLSRSDLNEFFVYHFLVYIKNTISDEYLEKDFSGKWFLKSNSVIDGILDEFFSDSEKTDRLLFLQKLLEL